MKVVVRGGPGDYVVWAMLDDDDLPDKPEFRSESFVIGGGATIGQAIDSARSDLNDALLQLNKAESK